MGFFKKEEKEVIKRSSLPELPDLPPLPELPSLPNLPKADQDLSPLPPNSPPVLDKRTIESETISPIIKTSIPTEKRTVEWNGSPMMPSVMQVQPTQFAPQAPPQLIQRQTQSSSKEPVFVKIEKFHEAVSKFEEIRTKIDDIEKNFKRIKEIKDKEEFELKSWEEGIKSVKEKADSIDSSLFNKI